MVRQWRRKPWVVGRKRRGRTCSRKNSTKPGRGCSSCTSSTNRSCSSTSWSRGTSCHSKGTSCQSSPSTGSPCKSRGAPTQSRSYTQASSKTTGSPSTSRSSNPTTKTSSQASQKQQHSPDGQAQRQANPHLVALMAGQPPSPLQAQRPHQSLALLQPPHSHRSLEAGQPQQKAVVREEAKCSPSTAAKGGCGPRNSGKSCEPSMKAWPQSAHGRPFKLVGRKLVSTWCNSSYTGRHGTLGRCTRNRVWCIIVKNTYKPIISHICSRVRLSVVAG